MCPEWWPPWWASLPSSVGLKKPPPFLPSPQSLVSEHEDHTPSQRFSNLGEHTDPLGPHPRADTGPGPLGREGSAFLTRSQEMLMLLAQAPRSEKQGPLCLSGKDRRKSPQWPKLSVHHRHDPQPRSFPRQGGPRLLFPLDSPWCPSRGSAHRAVR